MRFLAFAFLLTQIFACVHDESDVELIAEGLGIPWGMTFINDQELIVTQKEGTISLVNIETKELRDITGVPEIDIIGQGGLMDIALSPDFPSSNRLFFTYAKTLESNNEKSYATSLAVAKLNNDVLIDWQDLFVSNVQNNENQHFGSRIAFDNSGHVFFTHGDRGDRDNAQDLSNHAGTILRLNLDGSVPEDNPFVGDANAQPEIWSYGHRNPQGLVFDQSSQRLWSNEHGPKGGDEINLIEKGVNYGWPIISYGSEYISGRQVGEGTEKDGYAQPMKFYVPSIAPSSLIVYSGNKFAHLRGSLLSGALVLRHLNIVNIDQSGLEVSEERFLETLLERIRNVVEGPNGDIFVATDSGSIYKLLINTDP